MEIFLLKKNLIDNFEKNYKQTCSKQKIANVSSVKLIIIIIKEETISKLIRFLA